LGNKIAISQIYEFSERSGIPCYPFFGAGSLIFRGGLSPDSVDRFIEEFAGTRTVTVQSAFRYDHPLTEVKKAITKLETELPKSKPRMTSKADQGQLAVIAGRSAAYYKKTLDGVADSMQPVFKSMPKRRDRRQHIGLLAYSRKMGEHTLPRAITFTGGFYSVGIPPEFIGAGRTLKSLKPAELALLKKHYPNLAADYETAGRYLNRDNLDKFAAGGGAWQDIKQDVEYVEEVLGIKLGPKTGDEKIHYALSSKLIEMADDADGTKLITEMAVLRKSIG
jgi:phosphoenolpyruvate carboxylase